ncbi:MAG TPA: arylesterase, partial [Rhodospirillaceae bacterium]|nr:arylesterase [Rhodospirillaceae bacterium]
MPNSQTYAPQCPTFNVLLAILLMLAYVGMSPSAAAKPVKILAFGDSLTAGYGLDEKDGFTKQLARALRRDGFDARVLNAGVSGDTSAGGLARTDWVMQAKPDLVILELGANDGLRGLDPVDTKRNLDAIIRRIRATGS